jgi:hypothetical protein
MPLLCWSASCRRAERHLFPMSRVIAEIECHALSSWVDATCPTFQPTSRIIHTSLLAFN